MRWASGILGVEPWSWSMRDLFAAAHARWAHDWDRTALTCWLIAEPQRDRKRRSRPFEIADFHPDKSRASAGDAGVDAGRAKLTPALHRAQARAWFEKHGLPIPEKLRQ